MPLAATALRLLLESRSNPDEGARRIHHRLLDHLVRWAPGLVYVSRAAQDEATNRKLGDLSEYGWEHQKTYMRDPGRTMFAWDHFHTVKEMRDAIEQLASPTEEAVRAIVGRSCIVWILRAEDKELTKRGYRSKRADPHAAYAEAGITFVGDGPPR